ncbi:MAG: phosphopantetheine-binding protein [Acidimicrobiia bacterium]
MNASTSVESIFIDVLNLTSPIDWNTVRYQEIEGWDSLAHMAIVGEMEDRLGVMLDPDDIVEMSSYERALEILGKYGVEVA